MRLYTIWLSAEAIDLGRPYCILHPVSCHTPEAATTVSKCSWGWTQKASETCRVILQLLINILPSCITLVLYIYYEKWYLIEMIWRPAPNCELIWAVLCHPCWGYRHGNVKAVPEKRVWTSLNCHFTKDKVIYGGKVGFQAVNLVSYC